MSVVLPYAYPEQLVQQPEDVLVMGRESRLRSLLGGIAVLGIALFLRSMPFSPYWGTVFFGAVGTTVVWFVLYLKYQRRLEFTLEVALFAGMTIQYLLAPMAVRVLTSNFTVAYQTSVEREQIQDYYPPAMSLVLIFMGLYLIFSSALPLSRIIRWSNDRLHSTFSQRSYIIFTLLGIQLWLARSYLLASGSYYHSFRSNAQFDDPNVSALGQFAGGVGPLIVAFLWSNIFSRRRGYILGVLYSSFDILYNFGSGAREPTIIPLICILMTFVIYRRRFPWKTMLLVLPVAMGVLGFMDRYRTALNQTLTSATQLDISAITRSLTKADYATEREGGLSAVALVGFSRFDDLQSIARIYQGVPEQVDYLRGETYQMILPGFVPRAIWPDKPPIVLAINKWFFTREGGSSPVTIMGEGYFNYGYPGLIFAALCAATAIQFTNRVITSMLYNTACIPVYAVAIAIVARIHTASAAGLLTTCPKLIAMALLVHLCTRRRYLQSQPTY